MEKKLKSSEELVSIIVPVYNIENEVDKCVRSLVQQTYTNLQIILVNDGSTDTSLSICKEWQKKDPRIIVINKKNGGLSDARNFGINNADGDWIAMVDGDDYVKPNYIERMLLAAQKYDVQLVSCGCERVEGKEITHRSVTNKERLLSEDEFWYLYFNGKNYRGTYQAAWGKLYNRKIFEGGIRYKKGILHEDIDILYDLIHTAKFLAIIPDLLYCYQQRDGSITDKLNLKPKVDFGMLNISKKIYKSLLHDSKYGLAKLGLEDNIKILHYYIYASFLTSSDIVRLNNIKIDLLKDSEYLSKKGYPIRIGSILDVRLFKIWCLISKLKSMVKK